MGNSLLFIGDVCFNGRFSEGATFGPALNMLIEGAAVVVYNLEGPICNLDNSTVRNPNKTNLRNPCHTLSYLPLATNTYFNLANNHLMDFGEEGLKQTCSVLGHEGHRTFGAGKDDADATAPVVVNLGDKKVWIYAFTIDTGDSAQSEVSGVSTQKHLRQIIKNIKGVPPMIWLCLIFI